MCRFIFLVILVILLICGISSFISDDAFLWIVLIGVVGAPLGLLFFPKRGDQYAFQNLYRRLALILVIAIAMIFAAGFYFLAMVLPKESPEWLSTVGILGILALSLVAAFVVVRPYYPPTYKLRWIRKHFPEVFKAIQRYRRDKEFHEDYLPALRIDGTHYFLVTFYDRKKHDFPSAYLLLDKDAAAMQDETLFRKAVKCKTLAIRTIDYAYHTQRAKVILDAHGVVQGLGKVFDILRNQSEIILRHQQSARSDLEQVLATEEPIRLYAEATSAIQMLEAQWAKDHGLAKLTVVDYEDVENLIEQMRAVRKESVSHYETITSAIDSANKLIDLIKDAPRRIPEKKKVIEGLLGITDMGKGVIGQEEYDYIVPSERDLKAWRAGIVWAAKVDAELAAAKE